MKQDSHQAKSLARATALGVATATVLARCAPNWSGLRTGLSHPHSWVQQVGADHAAVALARASLWLAACWLALGLLLAVLAGMPGELGRAAAAIARRTQPKLLRRLIVTAAGASLVWNPVMASAAPPTSPSSVIVVTLPTDTGSVSADPVPSASVSRALTTPALTTPASATPTSAEPAPAAPTTPGTTTPAQTTPTAPATTVQTMTVRPGDSLWQLTAARLGNGAPASKIAATWPQLYAANRQVIGDDPGLLRPGQNLSVPVSIQAGS